MIHRRSSASIGGSVVLRFKTSLSLTPCPFVLRGEQLKELISLKPDKFLLAGDLVFLKHFIERAVGQQVPVIEPDRALANAPQRFGAVSHEEQRLGLRLEFHYALKLS